MKKLFTLVLTALLVLGMFAFPATAYAIGYWTGGLSFNASYAFDGGTGVSDDPYVITTETSLAQLAFNVSGGMAYSGVYFRLDDDLDLTGALWVPIGIWQSSETNYPFSGNFDGNGRVIRNVTVNETFLTSVGLFGYTTGALIEDLGVVNCNVTGQAMVGGLAGFADELTSIHHCYTTGSVYAVYNEGGTGFNGEMAGGLVGSYGNALTTIDGCWSSVNVDADWGVMGGLVGYMSAGHIKNSYATGTVGSLTSNAYTTGGFIGMCDQSIIEQCYATGDVMGTGENGGFIGEAYSNGDHNQIINCYARGNVNSYYVDQIDGPYGWTAGGFIGSIANTDISNCYSTGYISYAPATAAYYIGGFAGDENGGYSFTDCFFDITVAGREGMGNGNDSTSAAFPGITGLTTANMQGYDALTGAAKMDALDSGEGAPVSGVAIWYAHSTDYPDFTAEDCDVTYDSQGADTAASPATQSVVVGETVGTLPGDPVKSGCTFGGWWTTVNGGGTQFTASTPVPGDITVFAKWTKTSSATIYVAGRKTLSGSGSSGVWDYDSGYLKLTDNGDGTVKIEGLKAGVTTVTYTTSGLVEEFAITIKASNLPATGQDMTWVWTLATLAACAGITGASAGFHRRAKRV